MASVGDVVNAGYEGLEQCFGESITVMQKLLNGGLEAESKDSTGDTSAVNQATDPNGPSSSELLIDSMKAKNNIDNVAKGLTALTGGAQENEKSFSNKIAQG